MVPPTAPKVLSCTKIASGEEGAVLRSGKFLPPVLQRPKFGTARRGRLGPLGQRRNLERWIIAASPALPGR